MNSAIYSNLVNPLFIGRFFADSKSFDLIDSDIILTMFAVSRGYFEGLLADHWDWMSELLTRDEDVRIMLSHEYPDIVLHTATEEPNLLPVLSSESWREELKIGYERAGAPERMGIVQLYPQAAIAAGLIQ